MTSFRPIAFLIAAAAGIAGVAYYLYTDRDVSSAPVMEDVLPPATPPVSAPLLQAPAPTRSPDHTEGMIRYPDGTFMPALNGVKVTPNLQWPADLPFSPIVGKRVSVGTEWYVHADGTQSTSVMAWRSDLGREDALCHVARPMPALPEEKPDSATNSK